MEELNVEPEYSEPTTHYMGNCENYPQFIYSDIIDEKVKPFSLLWILLHLSNFVLIILFLLPNSQTVLWRSIAIVYSVVVFALAHFILHSADLIIWASIFCAVNLLHLIIRISKCRAHFSKDTEQVYRKLFAPLRVSRPQFSQILSCKRNTRILHVGESYSTEKVTRVDSLSLLVSGRLLVSQNGRPLHVILPHQFVDSPEYFGVSTDELFQVTITAVEESKLLVWHRDKLRLTIMSDEFLRIVFDHIIGRDVVRKLIQVSDSVTAPSANGFNPSQPATVKQDSTEESDPMLSEKNKEPNAIQYGPPSVPFDTDIPRIKYFANEVWSLSKIDEEMTPV